EAAEDRLVWSVNVDGRSTLHARRGDGVQPLPEIPPGVIKALALGPGADPIVMLLDTATRPTEIAVLDTTSGFRYLTDARPPALHVVNPVEPEPVVYPASAGRQVHALLYRPHTPGPHPVLLSIH